MAYQTMRNQAGNRIVATHTVTTPGERFGSRVTSHYGDDADVERKTRQLQAENPNAIITVKTS